MTAPIQRILVAVDETPLDDDIVARAVASARTDVRAEIHLVHVVEPMPPPVVATLMSAPAIFDLGRQLVQRTAAAIRRDFGGPVHEHLVLGAPAREILQLATDLEADLVIVGSHGKRALERLVVGSVAERIVRQAHCPVLVVRRKEYVPGVPEIEPPCPTCIEARRASAGHVVWCGRHTAKRTMHAHVHYESAPTFAVGSMLLRPQE